MSEHDWDEVWEQMDSGSRPDPLLLELVSGVTPGRAIDLGCGLGETTLALAAAGWDATGIDSSAAGVRRADEAATRRGIAATFEVADITDGVPGAGYDLITMFFIHLQTEDHARLLGRVVDALAPGGTFLYVGHGKDFVSSHGGSMGELTHGHEHGHHHGSHDSEDDDWDSSWEDRGVGGPEEIASLLAGLTVERAELLTREVHHGPQLLEMTDVVVVATKQ